MGELPKQSYGAWNEPGECRGPAWLFGDTFPGSWGIRLRPLMSVKVENHREWRSPVPSTWPKSASAMSLAKAHCVESTRVGIPSEWLRRGGSAVMGSKGFTSLVLTWVLET